MEADSNVPVARWPLFAVLIDGENINAKHAEPILKEVALFADPALRRVYGDWSGQQMNDWAKKARELGLVAHQETANTKGKNASDIGLVIDAMDILQRKTFDGFVLVSSDSDFTRLAARIREDGLQVVGIGEAKTPASLINVCNRFIFIENIVEDIDVLSDSEKTDQRVKKPVDSAAPLIIAAMDRIDPEATDFYLGHLGQSITELYPDFDCRTYGKKKLSDLVKSLKQFQIKHEGTVIKVRRKV
ncbi:MAG: NYN domain-containing protein [Paracoccaceae bacterium]